MYVYVVWYIRMCGFTPDYPRLVFRYSHFKLGRTCGIEVGSGFTPDYPRFGFLPWVDTFAVSSGYPLGSTGIFGVDLIPRIALTRSPNRGSCWRRRTRWRSGLSSQLIHKLSPGRWRIFHGKGFNVMPHVKGSFVSNAVGKFRSYDTCFLDTFSFGSSISGTCYSERLVFQKF